MDARARSHTARQALRDACGGIGVCTCETFAAAAKKAPMHTWALTPLPSEEASETQETQ